MSKNRNQSNRAAQSQANNKSTNAVDKTADDSQIKNNAGATNKQSPNNNSKTVHKETNTAEAAKSNNAGATNKQSPNNNSKTVHKETNVAEATKPNNAEAKEKQENTQIEAATTESPKTAKETEQNSKEKTAVAVAASTTANSESKTSETTKDNSGKQEPPKPETKKSEPAQPTQNHKAPEVKKPCKKLTLAALILGVAGTGLGAYSYNELRILKSATTATTDYSVKITALEKQLQELNSTNSGDEQKQISELISQVKTLKTSEAGISERVAQVEQAQVGVIKNTSSTLDKQLSAVKTTVADAKKEIENIKLGQQGLAKNISELTVGSASVSESGMSAQEVGYLLRMANFKLASERDLTGATGLLQMAADRLIAANDEKNTALIDSIRATTIQLQGVTLVDETTLFIQLGQISRDIPLLVVKSNAPAATKADADKSNKDKDETEESVSAFDKALDVFASGVKYTPKDPSKIDISAETVLIEKRLMQADIKTAEFAIRTHNKTLLSESFRAVRDKLSKNFAEDKTSKTIKSVMADIEQSELAVVLPNLSGLVKQFEQAQ